MTKYSELKMLNSLTREKKIQSTNKPLSKKKDPIHKTLIVRRQTKKAMKIENFKLHWNNCATVRVMAGNNNASHKRVGNRKRQFGYKQLAQRAHTRNVTINGFVTEIENNCDNCALL
jgi:hypothetical protein